MSRPNEGHCALLELPAELRVHIYELVLVFELPVNVTRQVFKEPPLLTACHQIRSETVQIYYESNKFILDAPSFDSTVLAKWYKKGGTLVERCRISNVVSIVDIGGLVNWNNLMVWLRRFHCGETNATLDVIDVSGGGPSDALKLLALMFCTAKEMKTLPWVQLEHILSRFRFALAKEDIRWNTELAAAL